MSTRVPSRSNSTASGRSTPGGYRRWGEVADGHRAWGTRPLGAVVTRTVDRPRAGRTHEEPTRDRRGLRSRCRRRAPSASELLPELVAHLREKRGAAARGVGAAHHRRPPADGDVARRGLLRGHVGVRQLRRGAGDRQRRGAAGLRPQPVRADHPPGRRDRGGPRHRPAAARRAGPQPVREVPGRLRAAQPGVRRLRAGRQPHRQHGGRLVRAGARARHPPAAGSDPRAVHPRAPGAGAAGHPAHHRRARQPAGPAGGRAAAPGHPHPPGQGGRHRHHRRARDRLDGGQPPGADRRGVAPDGRQRDHHRPVARDRPHAGHDRRRPVEDERRRRPAGRHRAGRAAAGLRGDPGDRWASRQPTAAEAPAWPASPSCASAGT